MISILAMGALGFAAMSGEEGSTPGREIPKDIWLVGRVPGNATILDILRQDGERDELVDAAFIVWHAPVALIEMLLSYEPWLEEQLELNGVRYLGIHPKIYIGDVWGVEWDADFDARFSEIEDNTPYTAKVMHAFVTRELLPDPFMGMIGEQPLSEFWMSNRGRITESMSIAMTGSGIGLQIELGESGEIEPIYVMNHTLKELLESLGHLPKKT